jgi:hypothetical protein
MICVEMWNLPLNRIIIAVRADNAGGRHAEIIPRA